MHTTKGLLRNTNALDSSPLLFRDTDNLGARRHGTILAIVANFNTEQLEKGFRVLRYHLGNGRVLAGELLNEGSDQIWIGRHLLPELLYLRIVAQRLEVELATRTACSCARAGSASLVLLLLLLRQLKRIGSIGVINSDRRWSYLE
jgi:hypothetical protein